MDNPVVDLVKIVGIYCTTFTDVLSIICTSGSSFQHFDITGVLTSFFCPQFPFTIPDPPGVPRVVDWDGSAASLIWDRPRSDGGARIQGYKLEYRDVQDGVWNSADYLVKDCNYQVNCNRRLGAIGVLVGQESTKMKIFGFPTGGYGHKAKE